MGRKTKNTGQRFPKQVGWWLLFLVCAFYAAYALYMGGIEILFQLGLVAEARPRAVPTLFVIHALAGSIVLVIGPLQFNARLASKRRKLHRILGRAYVGAIWLASLSGLGSAIFFQVNVAAKFAFGTLSVLWFATTTIALLRILKRDVAAHREWMIRSFSLSLFFVSFSFWVPGLTGTRLPEAVSYPLAVFLSWSLNLAAAQLWIRLTRPNTERSSASLKREYALETVN